MLRVSLTLLLSAIATLASPARAITFTFDDVTLQGWTEHPPFSGFLLPTGVDGELAMLATDGEGGGTLRALAPEIFSGDFSALDGVW